MKWPLATAIVCFSALAVYATSTTLHVRDLDTGVIYREQSLAEYRSALAGTRGFPYQWRLAGIYLVRAGERLTGLDPHTIDLGVKTALLALSSSLLYVFARRSMTNAGAASCVAIYLLSTVVGFSDGYSIYFTNDYAMIAAWFAAVWLLRVDRPRAAAAVTFAGSFAKETMLLVPVLAGIRWLRRRQRTGDVLIIALAFVVPTAMLRWIFPAPISDWAWWHMLFVNVPGLQPSTSALLTTLRNNLKVLLLFNVLWFVAARAIARGGDRFASDLGLTAVVYLAIAYPVIYVRELRHFLPLAIAVLPPAIAAFDEGNSRSSAATTATATNANANG
jgi:hypothetical protein